MYANNIMSAASANQIVLMGEERNHEPDTSDIDNEDAQLAMQFDGYDVERERVPGALITPAPSVLDPRSPPPMIRRVWMRNFKGYKEFEVALGRFNVLVGTNNSGKSTLLQAVDLLFALLTLHAENDRLATSGRLLPRQYSLWLV